MRITPPSAQSNAEAGLLVPFLSPRVCTGLVAVAVVGAFLFTFVTAQLRIFRQTPAIMARRAKTSETLRIENHGFYQLLLPVITKVREQVPEDGVVLVENFQRTEHQFLANYLAPRRIFYVVNADLERRHFGPAPVWILRLKSPGPDGRDFQLVELSPSARTSR
jgi:hypothetical protein